MDPARDGKGLPAAHFHVARSVHSELKNRYAGQLYLLKDSPDDVLWGIQLPRVGDDRIGGNETSQARIRRVENDVIARTSLLHVGLAGMPTGVVEFPIRPIGRLRTAQCRLSIEAHVIVHQLLTAAQKILQD